MLESKIEHDHFFDTCNIRPPKEDWCQKPIYVDCETEKDMQLSLCQYHWKGINIAGLEQKHGKIINKWIDKIPVPINWEEEANA